MTIQAPIVKRNVELHAIGARLKDTIRQHRALRVAQRMGAKLNCGSRLVAEPSSVLARNGPRGNPDRRAAMLI
jgi:hypothetical protein